MWQWIVKAFVAVGGPSYVFGYIVDKIKELVKQKAEPLPPVQTIPDPQPPEFKKIELWCPFADYSYSHAEQGSYAQNYPQGAVIHYTAGRDDTDQDAIDTLLWGKEKGYSFFMIAPSGKIFQTMPLNKWGHHCGKSKWLGLGENLSDKLVGIEIACAGLLESHSGGGMWRSWFGREYLDLDNTAQDQVREVKIDQYDCPSGHYKMFTKEQEKSLVNLLVWLKANNPKVFNFDYVLGHHEVSRGRKSDPGGSLSVPMSELRKQLKSALGN